MEKEIWIFNYVEDIDILNIIEQNVDIVIINDLVLKLENNDPNFDPIKREEEYKFFVQNFFRNIKLPLGLKELIIENVFFIDHYAINNYNILDELFQKLRVPFDCKIKAKCIIQENEYDQITGQVKNRKELFLFYCTGTKTEIYLNYQNNKDLNDKINNFRDNIRKYEQKKPINI